MNRRTTHKIDAIRTGFTNGMDWEASYMVTFTFLRGAPAQGPSYASGGQPADPDEIEAIDIKPEFGTLDAREKDEALDWANEWLQNEGFAAACEVVASDDAAAREYAAELRADR